MSAKISVIIPIYNVEKYLQDCLDSVMEQTLTDLEIICINDGSTDSSLAIIEKNMAKDERIVVCSQKNQGASVARNAGIDIATGEYIYFHDSDDFMEKDALEILYSFAQNNALDILTFNGDAFYENQEMEDKYPGYKTYYKRSGNYIGIMSGQQLIVEMEKQNEYRVSPCLYLLRRAYVQKRQVKYIKGIVYEDNAFYFNIMMYAKQVAHMDKVFYHRRVRADSVMTRKKDIWYAYSYFVCYKEMEEVFRKAEMLPENRSVLEAIVFQMLKNARSNYLSLEEPDLTMIPLEDQEKFRLWVVEICELRRKLQQTYEEKSEINRKLQRTYEEKSEINRKLQVTYKEKAERGIEVKKLKEEISELKKDKGEQRSEINKLLQETKKLKQENKEIDIALQRLKQQMEEYKNRNLLQRIRNK